ncbi:hypothetical protein NDN08_005386 [Rhodosorus marinus]|uniref:C2H2-type domain-containing protein n=1 Tax=Rhodosorus marinus TaxID=101924 RepID=A0AAV8V574_9RHOD|nr:hypothetical protein NDN08_005386 [Rhodosorus marinus]
MTNGLEAKNYGASNEAAGPVNDLKGVEKLEDGVQRRITKSGVVHVCPKCRFISRRKYNVKAHLRIHNNETPYKCRAATCGRLFRWVQTRDRHEAACHLFQQKDNEVDDRYAWKLLLDLKNGASPSSKE